MGSDLVTACIFCAGLLLGHDLDPRPGLSADIGFSYATIARRYAVTAERADGSDVTPKFLLVGLGQAWPAPDGLGGGTPASEWRVRIAFAASHDDQERKEDVDVERVIAKGNGRYENFSGVARFALGERNSLEFGGERRSHKATDLINIGGENQTFSEERLLTAERIDLTVGLRHRWRNWEAGAGVLWSKTSGFNSTAGSFHHATGKLWGWQAEARWQRNCWTALVRGQRVSGHFDVLRESFPAFEQRLTEEPGSLEGYQIGVGHTWSRFDAMLQASYDRQHLPFVSLAVLGTETLAFDGGFNPDSLVKEQFYEATARYALTPAIRLRAIVRLGWGNETVSLIDSAGVLPPRELDVKRRGIFGGALSDDLGSPQPVLYLGADFAIGSPH